MNEKWAEIYERKKESEGKKKKLFKEDSPVFKKDKHYIKNAGLALAAPFFCAFFDNLGFKDESGFKSEDFAMRAVHLTRYIATGEDSFPEYDLLFNKILCGVSADAPVPFDVRLTEKEKREADMGGGYYKVVPMSRLIFTFF